MTSKEALNDLKTYFDYHKDKQFEVIEKDLEVLEILKRHLYFRDFMHDNIDGNINYIGSANEFPKVKEWLENDK